MRTASRCRLPSKRYLHQTCKRAQNPPVVHIDNATFYRQYPSVDQGANNPPLFPNLSFSLPANDKPQTNEYWSVLSPYSIARTSFLKVLSGHYICIPPTARSYPYLTSPAIKDNRLHSPQKAIQYVGFDAERGGLGGTSLHGAYLGTRYESRKEETDWSLLDYLTGHTELNSLEKDSQDVDKALLERVIEDLNLRQLLHMPVGNLSNGQTRRARIAKSLMNRPELLLLDGPFMGLDPNTVGSLSKVLYRLAEKSTPRLFLSLRPEDHVPDWISHLVFVDEGLNVVARGRRKEVLQAFNSHRMTSATKRADSPQNGQLKSRDGFEKYSPTPDPGEAMIEMNGVRVSYGERTVLGDWRQADPKDASTTVQGLHWVVQRGQRWGVFGPNGSGKTTLLSLITSDHPQTYSLPIKLFGRSRIPAIGETGISIFELQRRIGHSSPEVHTFFPKQLTVRRTLESAWADAPLSKPSLDESAHRRINACLRWFAHDLNTTRDDDTPTISHLDQQYQRALMKGDKPSIAHIVDQAQNLLQSNRDLDWTTDLQFRDLPFSSQRLLLFIKAIVSEPDIVILDEALSGMDAAVRDRALLFLSHGETLSLHGGPHGPKIMTSLLADMEEVVVRGLSDRQALITISHSKEDVPGCVREWICLPEAGEGREPLWGILQGPLELNPEAWEDIWGVKHGDLNG